MASIAQLAGDGVGQIVQVQDDVGDARGLQPLDDQTHQRVARHRDSRLGTVRERVA